MSKRKKVNAQFSNQLSALRNPLCVSVVNILLLSSSLFAQRELTDIPSPAADEEQASFIVHEGFEVNLYASDPMIAKPIHMNFDPEGRLWLVSSTTYPQIEPGQPTEDKILVLTDRNRDGTADEVSTFADGLLIPTGLEPGDGGVYVANSTELLHLRDTDGDLKADERRVVLSGFGTEDTHHLLHTLRWGPDGRLYMNQSIYIHSHIETPFGPQRLNAGGVWRLDTDSLRMEVFTRGFVNSWGHHFDRWGQSFQTDGAYLEGINYVFPGAAFLTARDVDRILTGLNPGSPKHCGLEVLSGSHLPEDWRGNMITNDFRGHRVCRFIISEDGSGYASREGTELIKTTHVSFRPIDVKMGPDGAIYIADWYNPIIQHGEVDFRDERRDHVHGRIWRVTAKGRPLVEYPQLRGAPLDKLFDSLVSPEGWTRAQARRVIKERTLGSQVEAERICDALQERIGLDIGANAEDPEFLMEALWVLQSLHVTKLVEYPSKNALQIYYGGDKERAAAVRVLRSWMIESNGDNFPLDSRPLDLLSELVHDEHPRVRLESLHALRETEPKDGLRAADLALQVLDHPMDRWLDYSLWQTARELKQYWLPEVQAGRFDFGGKPERMIFALQALRSEESVPPLVKLLGEGKLPAESEQSVLETIATYGGPDGLALILDQAVASGADSPARASRLLAAMTGATQRRHVVPGGDLARLETFFNSTDDSLRAAALRAAGLWKVESLRPSMEKSLLDAATPDGVAQAAVDGLAALGGDASKSVFTTASAPENRPSLRLMSAVGLAALDLEIGAAKSIEVIASLPDGTDTSGMIDALLGRHEGAAALTRALTGKTLPTETAKIALRAVSAVGRPEVELSGAIAAAGGLNDEPAELTPEQMLEMVAAVKAQGDPARGELVFRSAVASCLKCHAIAGSGGRVGPDMTSLGASAQIDYLIDSLLLPNKAVKESYNTLNVETNDGALISGVKVRQSETELILRDTNDVEIVIATANIKEQRDGISIMPSGLGDLLTKQEFLDLIRFMSELGKDGPYGVTQRRWVRTWRVLQNTLAAPKRFLEAGFINATSDDPALTWSPAYSTVGGELPLSDLPAIKPQPQNPPYGFAQFRLSVTTPGKVVLKLNDATGITGWANQAPLQPATEMELDLASGEHRVTFVVDLAARTIPLQVELADSPGSAAQVQVVGGK